MMKLFKKKTFTHQKYLLNKFNFMLCIIRVFLDRKIKQNLPLKKNNKLIYCSYKKMWALKNLKNFVFKRCDAIALCNPEKKVFSHFLWVNIKMTLNYTLKCVSVCVYSHLTIRVYTFVVLFLNFMIIGLRRWKRACARGCPLEYARRRSH